VGGCVGGCVGGWLWLCVGVWVWVCGCGCVGVWVWVSVGVGVTTNYFYPSLIFVGKAGTPLTKMVSNLANMYMERKW
jgi:hypothetical protein